MSDLPPETRSDDDTATRIHVAAGNVRAVWIVAGLLICKAALLLHFPQLCSPALLYDDFQIVAQSLTWHDTLENLGLPHNEHVMPLGRLSTWGLVQVAGRATALPLAAALQGPMAILLGMILLVAFVQRERGQTFHALVAMALFGISTQYREAVAWFAASFAILALDTILLALLAAQRWRQTGRIGYLVGSAVAAGLAPCWFASGILAGPICSLYLLLPDSAEADSPPTSDLPADFARRFLAWLVPLFGTVAFIGIGILRNLDHIMHLEHWQGKTASEAFHPLRGLEYTCHSLIDNLLLGSFGIPTVICPTPVVFTALAVLGVVMLVWWWLAPSRRMVVLGLALIVVSYWLTYSARAEWNYAQIAGWGRYQLLPQFGLALVITGGLPRWQPQTGWRPAVVLGVLVVCLFASQVPRSFSVWTFANQAADLQRIDTMDERCRENRIDAATARQVLEPFDIDGCGGRINGWDFLRGSPDPQPVSLDEARRLLTQPSRDR